MASKSNKIQMSKTIKKKIKRTPEAVTQGDDTSLRAFMDRLPPCLCRAMAIVAVDGKPLLKPLDLIVKDGGLPRRTVQRISYQHSWDGIKVAVASAFIKGCGISILDNKDIEQFMALDIAENFTHLNAQQRTLFYAAMKKRGLK